jgi:DNA-binding response OmpR family regulator
MFKSREEHVSVLGFCVELPDIHQQSGELDFHLAHSARRAIELTRLITFDFAIVGLKLPDMSTWDFLRRMKTIMPQQKWGLVGGPISEQQEVTARMFGATTIFDATPTCDELLALAARLRQRAIASVLAGEFDRTGSASINGRSAVG